ncbi:MAG: tRNA modification GTPase [Phycisphaerae bacterium]
MQRPALDDSIVAIATAWQAAPVGIVRISGEDAFELVAGLAAPPDGSGAREQRVAPPRTAGWTSARLVLGDELALPATIFWFPAPRSYTGQNVVELHTLGAPPLLRLLAGALIERGARRALPGEFTARAFLAGKLDADGVETVLARIHAADAGAARRAARSDSSQRFARLEPLRAELVDLIAVLEAGIDFVDEEDVRLIAPADAAARIDALRVALAALDQRGVSNARGAKPHVALVGLPNAGKSTLFNALLGTERAIVAPIVGTTRDVLSAELNIDGVAFVLQDSAGLGRTAAELDLAAHCATEAAADAADLVLWVHAAGEPWTAHERTALARVPAERRLVVLSKCDLGPPRADLDDATTQEALRVSHANGLGLGELRRALATRLARYTTGALVDQFSAGVAAARAPLARALAAVDARAPALRDAELIAWELRAAAAALSRTMDVPLVDEVLGRIFSNFCIGK